ncbi:MAG: hypothetical protein SOZ38_02650 [Oscillospiraceae bacterium]|nr:hypothetical protein [Oscillospiraceae bacterium]
MCRTLPENSERDIANLLEINDNYSKYVLTFDEFASGNVDGVKIMYLPDFLLEK